MSKKHSKIFGVDLDPNNDMVLDKKPDGDCDVKYKGQDINFDTYIDELEDRANKQQKGKSITGNDIGMFSGVSFDKSGKIIRN
tara:strand:+ start:1134 stop:1382 length:249 start_codon:yes stop_codon:yes gene_type:complete